MRNISRRDFLKGSVAAAAALSLTGIAPAFADDASEEKVALVPDTTVICALGQRPRWNVAQELYDCAPWVRVIGDASAVGTITKATYQGHHAALDI